MTQRRRPVTPATTPITPGVGPYPDPLTFLDDETGLLADDITAKLNAGARLLYALYMHPQAAELMKSPYMTRSLTTAYMAACKAWGI